MSSPLLDDPLRHLESQAACPAGDHIRPVFDQELARLRRNERLDGGARQTESHVRSVPALEQVRERLGQHAELEHGKPRSRSRAVRGSGALAHQLFDVPGA